MANKALARVDSVVVTNNSESIYFEKRNLNIYKYPNGITEQQFKELSLLDSASNPQLVVSYVGKVGVAQNLGVLINVAEKLPDITFNIVGYGPQSDSLRQRVIDKELKNVNFRGNVDWSGVVKCYQESDVLYAQLSKNYLSAMPSKLYQYLTTGRFIIYGGEGEAINILSTFDNNAVIPPDDEKALINEIEDLQNKNFSGNAKSSNLINIQNNYVREDNVRKILSELF